MRGSRILETIAQPKTWPGGPGRPWGKLTPNQVIQRASWQGIPDVEALLPGMHTIHTVPQGFSTVTTVNPMEPGTELDTQSEWGTGYYMPPGHNGITTKAGRR